MIGPLVRMIMTSSYNSLDTRHARPEGAQRRADLLQHQSEAALLASQNSALQKLVESQRAELATDAKTIAQLRRKGEDSRKSTRWHRIQSHSPSSFRCLWYRHQDD